MKSQKTTRRNALLRLAGTGAGLFGLQGMLGSRLLAGGPLLPMSEDGDGAAKKILVMIQLSGGNDGLNTVVPIGDPAYTKQRPRLGIPAKDLHRLDRTHGLHPSLKGLSELYENGRLAVVQGVGYPSPNRSHFKSMDIWHAADPTARDLRFGWLGRAMDLLAREHPGDPDLGINLSDKVPLAMNGTQYKPVSFKQAQSYRYIGEKDETKAFDDLSKHAGKRSAALLDRLRHVAADANKSSREIRKLVLAYKSPVRWPRSQLSSSLQQICALLKGGLSTRVYYSYHNGFDTHVNQARRHAQLLTGLDQALLAFQKDLNRLGLADRVVTCVFSEFGRRVRENGSQGTDHGVAAPVFLVGKPLRGGLYGEQPSLTKLDKGDLIHNVDFRRIYASLLRGVLEVDAKKVLRGSFDPLRFLS